MRVNGERACIVGVGTSREFGFDLGKSPVALQAEAFSAALADAGVDKEEVDGFATAHGSPTGVDYEEFTAAAGLRVRYVEQAWAHGRWATGLVAHAAMAVSTGLADVVAIANTVTTHRGYARHLRGLGGDPTEEGLRDSGGGHGEWSVHGIDRPGPSTALVAQRYLEKYGIERGRLAEVSVAQRAWANLNPMATMHAKTMTLDDYVREPIIAGPLRRADFALTSEGSTCLLVTTETRAASMRHQPAFVAGFQSIQSGRDDHVMFSRPGLGSGFGYEGPWQAPFPEVFTRAGVTHDDIDGLYAYDAFSTNVWMVVERFGFCDEGQAPEWLAQHSFGPEPRVPVNTNGGMLSEGDYTGYGHIVEMVRQLRGQAGERQISDARVVQWATPWGDSLLLTA